jgi:hypothetical protein
VVTSEPVVPHHGREGSGAGDDEARPSASTACWAAFDLRTGGGGDRLVVWESAKSLGTKAEPRSDSDDGRASRFSEGRGR